MILMKLSIFILVTCTPIAIYGQKKMVLIVPRQVRRASPWRQYNRHPDSIDNEISSTLIRGHSYNPTMHLQPPLLHFVNAKARFRMNKNILPILSSQHTNKQQPTGPSGAIDDDFNNIGPVNHVLIPHGKGITHALSFGKGYVPHEAITGSTNSFSSQDNHSAQLVGQLPPITDHNSNYNHNTYYNQNNYDLTTERKIDEIKSLILKAKQLGLLNTNNEDYNSHEKSIMAHDIESINQNNYHNSNSNEQKGIIVRDTLGYDDYNTKITELAKNWPKHTFNNNNNNNNNLGTINVAEVAAQHSINFPSHLLGHINLNNQGTVNNHLLKQTSGYAVNEEVQDIPQDYNRYKPIAGIRPNPTPVATAAAIVATGAQVVPHLGQNQPSYNNLNPNYFSLHSPSTIFHG